MVAARVREHYVQAAKERQRAAGGDHTSASGKSASGQLAHSAKTLKSRASEEAGMALNVSRRSVDRARVVQGEGVPELAKKVEAGEMSLSKAAKIATLSVEDQYKTLNGEMEKPKKAAKAKPKRPDGPRPRSLSEKARYIKEWVGNGEKLTTACASCGMTRGEYQNAATVVAHGNEELIAAMDEGILTPTTAQKATKTPDDIPKIIEDARYKAEKKNHRQISARGKSKPQLLLELLGATYTDWKGAENNLPINSQTIPSDAKKLSEAVRLCRVVRRTVTFMLDKIEKEIEKCSVKTTDKKIS